MATIAIQSATQATAANMTDRIPVSQGDGLPKTVTVQQIVDKVPGLDIIHTIDPSTTGLGITYGATGCLLDENSNLIPPSSPTPGEWIRDVTLNSWWYNGTTWTRTEFKNDLSQDPYIIGTNNENTLIDSGTSDSCLIVNTPSTSTITGIYKIVPHVNSGGLFLVGDLDTGAPLIEYIYDDTSLIGTNYFYPSSEYSSGLILTRRDYYELRNTGAWEVINNFVLQHPGETFRSGYGNYAQRNSYGHYCRYTFSQDQYNAMTQTANADAFHKHLLLTDGETTVPANASSTGIKGQWAIDVNHFYLCIATNTWTSFERHTW